MMVITLLSKQACPLCDVAKEVLERVAAGYSGIVVEIVPLESERGQQLGVSSGMVFPPAVLVEGHPFSYGRLSERKLRRHLERDLHRAPAPPQPSSASGINRSSR
jgi:glutaredoxin